MTVKIFDFYVSFDFLSIIIYLIAITFYLIIMTFYVKIMTAHNSFI